MSATLVIRGQVVVAARPDGLTTAEAIGIAGRRVVSAGSYADVRQAAAPGARVVDARDRAVLPGLHDFHIHLVGLARARIGVSLDDAASGHEVARRMADALDRLPADAWLTGRGWSNAALAFPAPSTLDAAVGERLVFVSSHDGHSAWASPAARRLAGLSATTADPAGGRIERDHNGEPSGILRETAMDLVARLVPEPHGDALRPALDATLRELAALGITGVSEAGDYTAEGGIGADAALGDSFSTLTDLASLVNGRLRMNIGIPVDALATAVERGMRTGSALAEQRTLRFGWAKEYADGALGSGTAALDEPATGRDDTGILRVTPEHLDRLVSVARPAGIGLAIHAIGDRAAATVLDALGRAPAARAEAARDRIEHLQLLREADAARLAALGVVASIQPIHAAADRDLVEAAWQGRQDRAYAWRTLAVAGVAIAAGSDAPVESVNPWLGMFAAVHRRAPDDARGDWRPAQALTLAEALHAYTLAPANAIRATDEGHLRPGARADLAVLGVDLEALLAADERLAGVRSTLTLVDGEEAPLA